MKSYLVGGYVRDKVLGDLGRKLPPSNGFESLISAQASYDKDYVVVGGTAKQMLAHGFKQVGAAFPVFLHPETQEEYALARREMKSGNKHTDFVFDLSSDVTLEEDAQRRDFSINALYFDEASGELLDPTGKGLQDCKEGILRHVGIGFSEDPLRIMRCARLAAQLNFEVAHETVLLIEGMVTSGMLDHLSRERIDNEFIRALSAGYDSATFLNYLHEWGALAVLYPELELLANCTENPQYHSAKTTFGHVLAALDSARGKDSAIKIAITYHDIYKPVSYARKHELNRHVSHDDEQALDYLRRFLSQRKFNSRTKKLCKLAVKYHMRMRYLFEGMSVKKWVDMIASITSGFRADYKQQLIDLLEVCRADDSSDRTANCFRVPEDKHRWRIMRECALQTFDICNGIQARDIPDYQNLKVDYLKAELRRRRIAAVKQQVEFFQQNP
ncbi:MAG: multifunctional CCA tRNA nucleotidyl transferase/2'3'-cyclic phosphodiesterase/2'nucleotidase/phosphatase [Coriobacteriia bacterium]|nr:multifunctional CCA tRNA nucleotidyl transferase/2'3'-cyclic phosphodiesterase/2'nucleotidase/phosphatase [Coriobacteriia bacterium]